MLGTKLAIAVLVFTKTAVHTGGAVASRHEAIPAGVRAIEELGKERGWVVSKTEDAGIFNDESLARFNVAVFLMTTGDVLAPDQQAAFQSFIQRGNGYVGVHTAADTEYEWPFYGELVGAYFRSHPPIQQATYRVEDREHPATRHLPASWIRYDEQYSFRTNPRGKVHVLISVDETSYEAGEHAMGDHPAAWCRELSGGGRSFYTSLGHTKQSYSDPLFREHLASAIAWAASGSREIAPTAGSRPP